jgi:hypothetical protein
MGPNRRTNAAAALAIAAVMILGVGLAATVAFAPTAVHPSTQTHAAAESAQPAIAAISNAIHHAAHGHASHTTSTNWAGFVNTVASTSYGTIQEVTAEWNTPTVNCAHAPRGGAYQVSWVGIDGWNTGTVEQDGTLSYCSTTGATPAYYDWWEFYPYNGITTVNAISAGDFVQAYVLYNSLACVNSVCGVYTLQLSDLSASTSFSVTGGGWICNAASGNCEGGLDSSAECISEAPSGFGYTGVTPVANYHNTTFYGCADTIGNSFLGIGSWSSSSGVSILQVNQIGASSSVDQKTGAIASWSYYGNSKFLVTWQHYA